MVKAYKKEYNIDNKRGKNPLGDDAYCLLTCREKKVGGAMEKLLEYQAKEKAKAAV